VKKRKNGKDKSRPGEKDGVRELGRHYARRFGGGKGGMCAVGGLGWGGVSHLWWGGTKKKKFAGKGLVGPSEERGKGPSARGAVRHSLGKHKRTKP